MKNFIIGILLLLCLFSCAKDDGISTGNIYGIITESATAEPMRATGVELYKYVYNGYNGLEYHIGALLLKTVTYDDGHYEFNDLQAGDYIIKIIKYGYYSRLLHVEVQTGRTARADMQLSKVETFMTVRTLTPTSVSGGYVLLKGECTYEDSSDKPTEAGFYYSQSQNDILSGHKIKASVPTDWTNPFIFSIDANQFTAGVWYIQAYTKNKRGTEYGEIQYLAHQQHAVTVQKDGYTTNRKQINAVTGENTEVNITMSK